MNRLMAGILLLCGLTITLSASFGQDTSNHTPRIRTTNEVAALVSVIHGGDKNKISAAQSRLSDPDTSSRDALHDTYVNLLDDADLNVKDAAIMACGRLHLTDAAGKIRGFLKSLPRHDMSQDVHGNQPVGDEYRHGVIAADTLASLGDTASMAEILDRDVLAVSWEVIMPKFGRAALPLLIAQAHSSNPRKRAGALRAISSIRDDASTPDLIVLLKDPDSQLRNSAIRALAYKNDASALSAVEAIYKTLDAWGRIDFVSAACKQRGSAFVVPLGREFIKTTYDAGRRADMVRAVACNRDAATIQFLEDLLNDSSDATRAEAACQLAKWTGKAYSHTQSGMTKLLESRCEPLQKLNK